MLSYLCVCVRVLGVCMQLSVHSFSSLLFLGIDFKVKTIEVEGKKVKLQVW